jgi:hypothetical protein
MNRPELLVIPFVLLIALAFSTEFQRIVFAFSHRVCQLMVAAFAIAASILVVSPSSLPPFIADWITSTGYITQTQLGDHGFWFWRGLLVVSLGVIGIFIFSYLRSLVEVNRHLKDIETLMGNVSRQIPETRNQASGQGALRRAVDTMAEFFQR